MSAGRDCSWSCGGPWNFVILLQRQRCLRGCQGPSAGLQGGFSVRQIVSSFCSLSGVLKGNSSTRPIVLLLSSGFTRMVPSLIGNGNENSALPFFCRHLNLYQAGIGKRSIPRGGLSQRGNSKQCQAEQQATHGHARPPNCRMVSKCSLVSGWIERRLLLTSGMPVRSGCSRITARGTSEGNA